MNEKTAAALQAGFNTAFLDYTAASNAEYKPQFLSNDYKLGRKVLSAIKKELTSCDEFLISVAFVTMGGVISLLQILKELEEKDIPGKILTTDYQTFSAPKALRKLNELKNIQIKMFRTDRAGEGFHTKGYMFKQGEIWRIIVGGSNLTSNGLTKNREWNTRVVAGEQGEYTGVILNEFHQLWNSPYSLEFPEFIDEYSTKYELREKQKKIAKQEQIVSLEQYKLEPNSMQIQFISNLKKLVDAGETKALLISATGTGKTYASAFGLRELNPERALFIVHREQIARQAMASYHNVFGSKKEDGSPWSYALLSGGEKSLSAAHEADLVFATMQTLSRESILHTFAPDAFDIICEDEAHHAGAESYRRIMDYFSPKFWLGMTASPDTNRFDVYELFDHNIAYEIRLQQALEQNLLCPFHYFGITDLEIDGEVIGDSDFENGEKTSRAFSRLTSDARVDYIVQQANFYGYSGERVKGLIFCSRNKEAWELSKKFNERGLRTAVLTGADNQEKREAVIERLVSDDKSVADKLDYILSVDIFSEGVDIPEINQVIMLRPTRSPIVFVQQIGRGLRKSEGKEYVVILDFIGNYKNNFMIPIALSGDRSYNKDNIRRYLIEGERIIPGASTIHFDEISRKRIFEAIDDANFSDLKLIKENYNNLKNKLGRIPALADFDKYGEMDVCRIFDNKSLGSYYKFLVKYEKEYKIRLTEKQEKIIEFVSGKLAPGKRIHELQLLDRMLSFSGNIMKELESSLSENYGIQLTEPVKESVIHVLTNEFPSGAAKKTYRDCVFLEKSKGKNNEYETSAAMEEMLKDEDFRSILKELIAFGISRYQVNYSEKYQDTDFSLYQKYTYEDVCRLLLWEHSEVPLNIGGYKYDKKTHTFPVFINYDKADDIRDTIRYEDHFTGNDRLIAISKSGRSIQSEDVQNFLNAKERGIDVHLFVRKNKDDRISKEFYYLGRMKATGAVREFQMENTEKTAVEIEWLLDTPIRDDLYEYLIS